MLTTQMVSADYVQMELPEPDSGQASKLKEPNKVIVNVIPYGNAPGETDEELMGTATGYSIGVSRFKPSVAMGRIAQIITTRQHDSPDPDNFVVEIRADKDTRYSEIVPVLRAVQKAEVEKMRITTVLPPAGGGL